MSDEGRWERASGIAWFRLQELKKQHVEDAINQELDRKSHG